MLSQMFKPSVSAPNKLTPEEIMKERYTHQAMSLKLRLLGSQYKRKLLPAIAQPGTNHDFMCHTYSASYVLHWLYANKYTSAKPLPVRSREAQGAGRKTYTRIIKAGAKEDAYVSMRSISKKMGLSNVGELVNGDELCTLLNHCKTLDPGQNFVATSMQIFNKDKYIKTLIAAVDHNTPPLVVFDSEHPIGQRQGQHEHVSVVAGYVQSPDKVYFIIIGSSGYWLTEADTLYASTSQLQPRYYNKLDFKLESTEPADQKVHQQILKHYSNADSVKIKNNAGIKAWFPVTRISSALAEIANKDEVKDGLLPAKYQRKIATRQANKGWKNTIVIIKPVPIKNEASSKPKMRL